MSGVRHKVTEACIFKFARMLESGRPLPFFLLILPHPVAPTRRSGAYTHTTIMPTGGIVIDAFKSTSFFLPCHLPPVGVLNLAIIQFRLGLIRHGKQHHEQPRPHDAAQTREKPASGSHRVREKDQRAAAPVYDQNLHANQHQQQQGGITVNQQPMVSPNYRREAELIVQEENKEKSKMPSYKGLEKFKLLEKMGEYVPPRHLLPSVAITHPLPKWRFL